MVIGRERSGKGSCRDFQTFSSFRTDGRKRPRRVNARTSAHGPPRCRAHDRALLARSPSPIMVWLEPAPPFVAPPGRGAVAAAVVGDACVFIGGADRDPEGAGRRVDPDVRAVDAAHGAVGTQDHNHARRRDPSRALGRVRDGRRRGRVRVRGTGPLHRRVLQRRGGPGHDALGVASARVSTRAGRRLRNGHIACAVRGGEALVVYGGSSPELGPMGDVHVLNRRRFSCGGDPAARRRASPEPREMHAGVFFAEKEELLVAGGRGRDGVVFRDAHVLDVRLMKWTRRFGFFAAGLRAVPPLRGASRAPKRKPPSAGGAFFGGFDGAALRASSDLSLLEPTTLAKTVLSGDDQSPSLRCASRLKIEDPAGLDGDSRPPASPWTSRWRAARRACSWFSGGSRRRSTWRTSPRGWTRAIIRTPRARERGGDRGARRPRSRPLRISD